MNARRNDVTQNPLEAPGSDHRSGEALARPIGRVVRFLVAPALAIMNRMNYVLKFLLVGLLLLLPFAYVTHLMVEASKKQSSFNQKESYGVEYVAAALDLLGTVEDARVVSSAIVAGDSSLAADLARDDEQIRSLVPRIDAMDGRHLEHFATDDGQHPCSYRWQQIRQLIVELRPHRGPSPAIASRPMARSRPSRAPGS